MDYQVETIHCMVMNDRRETVQHTVETMDISAGSVHAILIHILRKSNLLAKWLPIMLTPGEKLNTIIFLEHFWLIFKLIQSNSWEDLWPRIRHRFNSLIPNQSFKANNGNKVAWQWLVFWGSEGKLMINFLQRSQTINEAYYASELQQMKEASKEKRREKLWAGVPLLQNNVPIHTAQVAVVEAAKCGLWTLLNQPFACF